MTLFNMSLGCHYKQARLYSERSQDAVFIESHRKLEFQAQVTQLPGIVLDHNFYNLTCPLIWIAYFKVVNSWFQDIYLPFFLPSLSVTPAVIADWLKWPLSKIGNPNQRTVQITKFWSRTIPGCQGMWLWNSNFL